MKEVKDKKKEEEVEEGATTKEIGFLARGRDQTRNTIRSVFSVDVEETEEEIEVAEEGETEEAIRIFSCRRTQGTIRIFCQWIVETEEEV